MAYPPDPAYSPMLGLIRVVNIFSAHGIVAVIQPVNDVFVAVALDGKFVLKADTHSVNAYYTLRNHETYGYRILSNVVGAPVRNVQNVLDRIKGDE